jgi:hypothetical protein
LFVQKSPISQYKIDQKEPHFSFQNCPKRALCLIPKLSKKAQISIHSEIGICWLDFQHLRLDFSAPKPAAVTEDSKFAGSFQNCSLALRPVRHNSCLGEIKFSPRGLYIHTDTRTRTHTHTHIHAPDHSRTQLKKKKRGGGKNTKKPTCTGPTRPTNSVCVQRA